MHQSRLHPENSFVTLTYDPESLPRGGTLVKRHVQLFIKRLRRSLGKRRISYFAVGEYGDESQRPHYHALLFGYWPADAQLLSSGNDGGHRLYTSRSLSALWTYGFVSVGSVTPESCAYTAAYCVKKVTGPLALEHYTRITQDGEMIEVIPEFALMSRNPAIGKGFYEEFHDEIRNSDFCLLQGKKVAVPRYYDRLKEREDAQALANIKEQRRLKALKHRANNTPERLEAREEVARSKKRHNMRTKL